MFTFWEKIFVSVLCITSYITSSKGTIQSKGYTPKFTNFSSYEASDSLTFSPSNWDWRDHGIVGPIKDQKQCGSCWAFSAVGALESQVMKLLSKTVSLSEQNMVDCVKDVLSPDNKSLCCDGCNGGEMYSVYQYLANNQGGRDDTELEYPYTGVDQSCNPIKDMTQLSVKGFVSVPSDEEMMKHVLYNVGPLSVGVCANWEWQSYLYGIYSPTSEECGQEIEDQDHGVILVGYGSENGTDYWIVRNSWGTMWGEEGYMRLARGINACGVANSVIYPLVKPKMMMDYI